MIDPVRRFLSNTASGLDETGCFSLTLSFLSVSDPNEKLPFQYGFTRFRTFYRPLSFTFRQN